MSRLARSTRGGFTLLELAISIAFSSVAMGSFMALFGAADGLSTRSRTALRSESEHRSNLVTVAALLRDAAPASLAGFDTSGRATSPRFKRLTGISGETPVLGPEQTLLWVVEPAWGRTPANVRLGQVVVRDAGGDRTLARRVLEGSFQVIRSGRTLSVSLTSHFDSLESALFEELTDQVDVCLRN